MPETLDNERFRLLLRAVPGKAIEIIYNQYYEGLVHLSMKFVGVRPAAEDIVQETFVHLWEKHKTLSEYNETPINFYLARVVKNKSITHYKKTLRLQETYAHYLNGSRINAIHQTIETQWIDQEISDRIKAHINSFPPREKQCLTLKIDHLMTTKEIAAELGVSIKAVERSLTSAHKRLRQWAKKEY